LATHCSAESETLVVRSQFEELECLIEDAPDTYYLTDYYRKYPIVLVRLSRITVTLYETCSLSHGISPWRRRENVTDFAIRN